MANDTWGSKCLKGQNSHSALIKIPFCRVLSWENMPIVKDSTKQTSLFKRGRINKLSSNCSGVLLFLLQAGPSVSLLWQWGWSQTHWQHVAPVAAYVASVSAVEINLCQNASSLLDKGWHSHRRFQFGDCLRSVDQLFCPILHVVGLKWKVWLTAGVKHIWCVTRVAGVSLMATSFSPDTKRVLGCCANDKQTNLSWCFWTKKEKKRNMQRNGWFTGLGVSGGAVVWVSHRVTGESCAGREERGVDCRQVCTAMRSSGYEKGRRPLGRPDQK